MLPKLLGGPILRRSDSNGVFVWLATSVPFVELALDIYEYTNSGGQAQRGDTPVSNISESHSFRFGSKLYLHLIAAKKETNTVSIVVSAERDGRSDNGTNGLPRGAILGYDIRYKMEGVSEWKHLHDLGNIDDFVYRPYDLPTFILQTQRSNTFNCLYGSCRKMHGYGVDAIQAADIAVRINSSNVTRRPHVLLLGGDQIYADDVSDVLIRPIQDLAIQLIGFDEPLPGIPMPRLIPIGGRSRTVGNVRFRSGEAGNHLMTFSEFAATYLFAWNPDIWPSTLQDSNDQRRRVLEAKTGARYARRVLANVPTYMAFDDHEITDDWYFNNQWKREVQGKPLGKRILANGIAAFWAFQGWGNNPAETHDRNLAMAAMNFTQDPSNSDYSDTYERQFLEFQKWSFRTPTKPSVILTNTRTQRGHSSNRVHTVYEPPLFLPIALRIAHDAPTLMNSAELTRFTELIREAKAADSRLVVVTPTPVYGLETQEFAQNIASNFGISGTDTDNESFHADPNSFLDIIQTALNSSPSLVIFLSGDVHYGFSVAAKVSNSRGNYNVAQFTSSATKNEAHGGLGIGLHILQLQNRSTNLLFSSRRRHWWRIAGRTTRISSLLPLNIASIAFIQSLQNSNAFGPANIIEESKFIPRQSNITNVITGFQDLVVAKNNFGQLRLRNTDVHNKLLSINNSSLEENLVTNWTTWPI